MAAGSSNAETGWEAGALIAAIQAGSAPEENFRRLFLRYHRVVHGFFTRRGLKPEECQDLTQETFLGIFRGMGTFRPGAPFEPWLFAVAANAYRKRLRHLGAARRSAEEVPLAAEGGAAGDPDRPRLAETAVDRGEGPGEAALERERAELLREAIDGLPAQMRACLVLRVDQDLSYREIAEVLRLSAETVKAHLFQARQRLKERLGEYFLPEDRT